MEDGREGSEKQAVAAKKKLARSGSKDAAGAARSRPTPVRGHRRWSSSTDLDIVIETAPVVTPPPTHGSAAAPAAVLGRSFSTTAAISVAVDGGVNHQQAAPPEGREAEEGEQRPRRRCGAGARLSRKIKEHRARFYIIRRCVAMLVCWRDADD